MDTTFIVLAAAFGGLGVALGAFGAHALRARFEAEARMGDNYRTAVSYQMYHVPGLLAVAWAQSMTTSGLLALAGWLFVVGIVLFSGSLYALVYTGNRKLGAITPIGGLAFIAGWIVLAVGVLTV